VIVDGDRAALIDWGSSRTGPAMLDLVAHRDTADVDAALDKADQALAAL